MKRVLILTAGYGEGHNTAARSLAEGLALVAPGAVEAEVVDLFETSFGAPNELVKKGYLAIINHAPALWEKIYEILDTTALVEHTLPTMNRVQRALALRLEAWKPDVVVATYPVYAFLLERLLAGRPRTFPFLTIVTDSVTVNSVWFRAPSDCHIVANEDTAAVMRQRAPHCRVEVLGFPVSPRFAVNPLPRQPPGAGGQRPRVLFMVNGGRERAPSIVQALLSLGTIALTVTVGRDEKLRAEVAKIAQAQGQAIEIHGWTKQLPELLLSHHLLIGKAGGATTQEAIAAGTPMIVSQVVPGQEEGNARLLVDNHCGEIATTAEAIAGLVRELFADDAARWREWHFNLQRIGRPDAARAVAAFVLANS